MIIIQPMLMVVMAASRSMMVVAGIITNMIL
jgi:hypothetical protein